MSILTTALTLIAHELDIFFSFSWRDWSTSLIPGSIFAVGGMRTTSLSLSSTVLNYLFLVSWLTFFIYFFTLSNQITGVDEDRINKPDRPIPSDKVSLAGAKKRWIIVLPTFLALTIIKPTLLPKTVCWVLTTAFLNLTPAGTHWFGKNTIAMTVGTWCLLSGSWEAVALATPTSERWTYSVAMWTGLVLHIQDLRDIEGDRATGRKTLPLVYGDSGSRWIITFVFVPLAMYVLHWGGVLEIAPRMLIMAHLFLGYRVMHAQGSRYDHKTYMVCTYLFCLILAVAAGEGLEVKAVGQVLQGWAMGRTKL